MTEKDIQNKLFEILFDMQDISTGFQKFYFITPNVTLFEGWESDLIVKDSKERIYEFEIKTSKEDFLADKKKKRTKILKAGNDEQRKPNFFYYILPESADIKEIEVPEFAGFYIYRAYQCNERGLVIEFFLQREAPLLTERLTNSKEIQKLLTSIYFKFWRERTGINTRIQKKVY
jgi:hypothetical protein